MTPEEFERHIAKIHHLLEGQGTSVQWNAHIPDPDNPTQKRQVDVLIDRDGSRTLVECRFHSRAQDVKWIEELFGRRVSLQAETLIAVSSSGFTEGAIRKASKMGVILRDYRNLTGQEILDWGKKTKVILEYIKFERAEINLLTEIFLVRPVVNRWTLFQNEKGKQWPVENIFRQLAGLLKERPEKEGTVGYEIFPANLYVGGIKIPEMFVRAQFRVLNMPVDLPTVQIYGEPAADLEGNDMIIEKEEKSDMGLYRTPSGSFIIADISTIKVVDSAFFQAFLFDLGENPPGVKGVRIVGRSEPSVHRLPLSVKVIPKNSHLHYVLSRGLDPIATEITDSKEGCTDQKGKRSARK